MRVQCKYGREPFKGVNKMHCRAVVRERGEPRLESCLGRKHSKKEHAFHLLLAGSCGREVTFIAITQHLHALVIFP